MNLRLGIDTGGTYTDAVLVDAENRILAAAKELTTRHELTIGIGNVLRALPPELLAKTTLVALSTTLSTNSVVEGRGAPVCTLLPGYNEQQIKRSGLNDLLEARQIVLLEGAHNSQGEETEPLDEAKAREYILKRDGEVSAFAISGLFGTRNPAHEVRLRSLVQELTGKPVTCGHELASSLGAPRRALTAALNARMIPTIHHLIDAMQHIQVELGIDAPLMMVKGDGSLINTNTAVQQPVGTVLSGPAASVLGACAMSGTGNALIADMGGTTTDIAIVTDGQPELGTDGVRIGDLEPMVEAVRVFSIGLGGDSEVRFGGHSEIVIGPRRVIPLSLLTHQYPETMKQLARQLETPPDRRDNRFALRLDTNKEWVNRLTVSETSAWDLLVDGPVEMKTLIEQDRPLARAMARLERMGLAIYSGFTPSDAMHVLGKSNHWNTGGAKQGAILWARQMRNVYGLGKWENGDPIGPSEQVFTLVVRKIARAMIEAGLHQHGRLSQANAGRMTGLLADLILEDGTDEKRTALFHPRFASDYPLVAVGAPAATFYPSVTNLLNLELILPDHAEVANAYGAVMCGIVQRAEVIITQPRLGRFVLHSSEAPRRFTDLEQAVLIAESLATEAARQLAIDAGASAGADAGAGEMEINLARESNHVHHDIDGELFLEMKITATAIGRPRADQDQPVASSVSSR